MTKSNILLPQVVAFSLVSYSILQTYGWGGFNFAFILAIFCIIAFFISSKKKVSINKPLKLYLLYTFFISFVLLPWGFSFIPINVIRVYFYLIMLFTLLDVKNVLRLYRVIAIICICFFFIQEVSYSVIGFRMTGLLPHFPVALEVDMAEYEDMVMNMNRSSSFFSEPAHFAQFLLPLLCVELMWNKTKFSKIFACVIVLVLLLLRSGNAIVGLFFILLMYTIFLLKQKKSVHNLLFLLFFFASITVASVWFMSTDIAETLLDRGSSISLSAMEYSSDYVRLFRGYEVYGKYPIMAQIIGMYNPTMIEEVIKQGGLTDKFLVGGFYYNGIQSILLFTGLIGFVMFCRIIRHFWVHYSYCSRTIIVVLTLISFVGSTFLDSFMVMSFYLAGSLKNNMQ